MSCDHAVVVRPPRCAYDAAALKGRAVVIDNGSHTFRAGWATATRADHRTRAPVQHRGALSAIQHCRRGAPAQPLRHSPLPAQLGWGRLPLRLLPLAHLQAQAARRRRAAHCDRGMRARPEWLGLRPADCPVRGAGRWARRCRLATPGLRQQQRRLPHSVPNTPADPTGATLPALMPLRPASPTRSYCFENDVPINMESQEALLDWGFDRLGISARAVASAAGTPTTSAPPR